jgi:hypothetical protein
MAASRSSLFFCAAGEGFTFISKQWLKLEPQRQQESVVFFTYYYPILLDESILSSLLAYHVS